MPSKNHCLIFLSIYLRISWVLERPFFPPLHTQVNARVHVKGLMMMTMMMTMTFLIRISHGYATMNCWCVVFVWFVLNLEYTTCFEHVFICFVRNMVRLLFGLLLLLLFLRLRIRISWITSSIATLQWLHFLTHYCCCCCFFLQRISYWITQILITLQVMREK